jgi:hypothetical protein
MVFAIAALLICATMFAVYAIVRTEEHHLVERRKDEGPLPLRRSKIN